MEKLLYTTQEYTDFICSWSINIQGIALMNRLYYFKIKAHRTSDGSMSASGSAGPGSIPGGVVNFHLKILVNFHLKIFNLGAWRGGDVHFLIVRLCITVLD